ncbi:hypothetical protein MLD52_05435 [Puniceicoccaceae bacterium K14]|nr:hypothetical protein [Puniceicoccaceae bacterium K14]
MSGTRASFLSVRKQFDKNPKEIEKEHLQLVSRAEAAKLLSVSTRTLDRILADSNKFT